MNPVVVRIVGLMMLVVMLSAAAASAQEAAGGARQLRWSVEGSAGVQLAYTGTIQCVAVGFAPTRSLTLLISAERSRTEDEIEFYPDGYASERGGVVEFVSGELRYAFFANKRVSPYAVGGFGSGVERPNVNEFFPHGVDRNIVVIYYGAGARIPIHRRLDAFADWRLSLVTTLRRRRSWDRCAPAWPSVSEASSRQALVYGSRQAR
jgi:hypothetical protein